MPDSKLVVFLKAPRAGVVKTRLAGAIGAEQACLAYRELVEGLVRNLKGLEDVELRFTPDDAESEIRQWREGNWRARPQGEGDLGGRLESAFASSFAEGAERVVVIGSDCPDVTRADIAAAWNALERHDLVLGPASDGGYWLIGLRCLHRELFEDIPWSRTTVLEETLGRARCAGLSVFLLRELSDVDTEEDWRRFQSRRS